MSIISFNLLVKCKLQWLVLITQIIDEDRSHSLYAVDSEIHHPHVIFQIMLYININVWVLMLIFLNNTEASKPERKITPADTPSLSTSIPTTVSAETEQEVSVKSQIKEEEEDWPIREMIAILGSSVSAVKLWSNCYKVLKSCKALFITIVFLAWKSKCSFKMQFLYEIFAANKSFRLKGGVLGFWGGVGLMGTIFLLVLVTQRCCSRRGAREKKEVS